MTKDQIKAGLLQGRTLIQEEWADDGEIKAVDELIYEGVVSSTPWEWKENYQCERRRITARKAA